MKNRMKISEYRRGEVYEINGCTAYGQPTGDRFPVLIIQNDAGEIPCQTITALRLRERACPSFCQSWRVRDQRIHRFHKKQIRRRIGRLSDTEYETMIHQAERYNGIHIPEVLEAP